MMVIAKTPWITTATTNAYVAPVAQCEESSLRCPRGARPMRPGPLTLSTDMRRGGISKARRRWA